MSDSRVTYTVQQLAVTTEPAGLTFSAQQLAVTTEPGGVTYAVIQVAWAEPLTDRPILDPRRGPMRGRSGFLFKRKAW